MDPFSIIAPTASADGYGASAEGLVLSATQDHGADIAFIEYDWRDARYTDPALFELQVPQCDHDVRDILIVYFLPYGLGRFHSRVTLNMTMWETDRLPEKWATLIDFYAAGVIVPSTHGREVFEKAVSVPVRSAPFGTNTDLYTYVERDPSNRFVFSFLMTGLLHYRKGLEFALRAFREEFKGTENVRLVLKTRRNFLDAGDEHYMMADPRVTIIDEDYTREEMRDLYHRCDCFLAPSRGEGSGLTPRDAMATGLPVILTDWGGLAELADDRYTYPIPVDDLEPAPTENSSYGAGVTGGGDIGNFARPSIPALRAAMRAAYEDREESMRRGKEAALWTRRCWTWERCSYLWLNAISELTELVTAV